MTWVHLPKSPCSPVPAGECGPAESLATRSSATSSSTPSATPSCGRESVMDGSTMLPSGTTSPPSTGSRGVDWWISSLAASRVSHSRSPASDEKGRISATCGRTPLESLARYDQRSRSWRTSQGSLPGISPPSSVTLPRWGMTLSGECFLLPRLERRTSAEDFGLSRWTPTATVGDARSSGSRTSPNNKAHDGMSLCDVVERNQAPLTMWATPLAADGTHSPRRYARGNLSLTAQVAWDTPNAADAKRCDLRSTSVGGRLSPRFVEWLMGWPIGATGLQPLGTARFPCVLPLPTCGSRVDMSRQPHE